MAAYAVANVTESHQSVPPGSNNGWTIVDTGIRGEETREHWRNIFATCLKVNLSHRLSAPICTRPHGTSGILVTSMARPLLMSYSEYYQARLMGTMMEDGNNWFMSDYFERAGLSIEFLEQMRDMRSQFTPEPEDLPIPGSYIRLSDGEEVHIGRNSWEVVVGNGHSPEHVCLYCKKLKLLISGDQILPIITSNVSVMPTEPLGNPMLGWMQSHQKFKLRIPKDTLVLPAHNEPFYGVQERLQQLIDHHEDRMLILEENCVEPQIAVDLLPHLFKENWKLIQCSWDLANVSLISTASWPTDE